MTVGNRDHVRGIVPCAGGLRDAAGNDRALDSHPHGVLLLRNGSHEQADVVGPVGHIDAKRLWTARVKKITLQCVWCCPI